MSTSLDGEENPRLSAPPLRRRFLRWVVPVVLLLVIVASLRRGREEHYLCPGCNVILICVDALRADHLGVYGYARNTSPYVDELARESLVFDQAITQASWTIPSVLSILTSRYPPSIIPYTMGVPPDDPQFARVFMNAYPVLGKVTDALRAAGYATGAVSAGGYLNADFGWGRGFGFYHAFQQFNEQKYTAHDVNQRAFPWLETHKHKRFFLLLHYLDVHCPYLAPKNFDVFSPDGAARLDFTGKCTAQDFHLGELTETEQRAIINRIVDKYDAGILHTDAQIGELLQKLKSLGLDHNTIVVLLADHGEELGDHAFAGHHHGVFIGHAYSLFNEVVHVPLIIKHPRLKPRRIPYRVRLIDIAPTVLGFLGIKPPAQFEGKSLVSFLKGTAQADRDAFTVYMRSGTKPYEAFALMSGGFKYILFHYRALGDPTREFLYDLRHDPGETVNLAQQTSATIRFRGILTDWLDVTRKQGEALQRHLRPVEHQEEKEAQRIQEGLKSLGYVE